jgi:hypothetical protein
MATQDQSPQNQTPTLTHAAKAARLLAPALQREIACASSTHPKTVQACLAGRTPKGLAGHRLRAEFQRRGLMSLVPHLATAILGSAAERPGIATDGEDE